ncbi:carboxymuconolactone decarboxylase family protein [Nocardioides sp.]|uniref:carboxymuconolactone decarboxylase family protein n=1 Tax=Nocardioides sp. TaxID=35761 RepID=UPI002720272D|nr:hypothetical protein [Nocardioides sp.]MDO9454806.1 hypothetical protein [Nocardioides sp.]
MGPIDLANLRAAVEERLAGAPSGAALPDTTRVLVRYALCASVLVLDVEAAEQHAAEALELGITAGQLHEVLALVSGLGVHSLMEGSRSLAALVERRGGSVPEVDETRSALRERLLGSAPFWAVFEAHVPGFLDALLRLSPDAFQGFVDYGAIPARTRLVDPLVKELVSVAVDAMPTHRYLPGLLLHVDSALRLGAGRTEVLEVLDLAAQAPAAPGVR